MPHDRVYRNEFQRHWEQDVERLTYKHYPEYGPCAVEWYRNGRLAGSSGMPFPQKELGAKWETAVSVPLATPEERSQMYRASDPELAYEDSFSGTAKKIVHGHGRRLAKVLGRRLDELTDRKTFDDLGMMVENQEITNFSAGVVLEEVCQWGNSVESVVKELCLRINDTNDERVVVNQIVLENPPALVDYLGGKMKALGSLIGAAMKRKKGLNPVRLRQEFERAYESAQHCLNFRT
jgi:hypothetical protein